MKKIIFLIFFFLTFLNISHAKILDVGLHKLELPSKFYLIKYSDIEFAENLCQEFPICFGIVEKTIKEIVD